MASNDRNIAIIIHPAGKNCKHFSEKRAIFGEKTAQKWEFCATARYAFQDGYDAALRLLEQPGLTAIFAMSDVMAIGAMRALHDRGLRIPEDISVIGFDGLELGEFYTPKLTTIRQQASLLVDRGVALLLGTLERGAVARHETVPFTLAVRESTSHPPRKDGTNS